MTSSIKITLIFIIGIIAGIIIISQLSFTDDGEQKAKDKNQTERIQHTWYAPPVPKQMTFAGENVPLDRWDVYERFDRELLYNYYWQNNILYMLKLANRYFPVIQERLKANGIPDDFKYLCVAESNMLNATSRAGAVGFWQFMPKSGPDYNLEINSIVDERYDFVKSTDAACKYLKQAYAKFGNWTAAAASYNCGQGGYNSNATFQKTNYYYDLMLPEETHRYIFRILAFKHLMGNAKEFGFDLNETEAYQPLKTRLITITSSIPDLAQWAINNGTNYKMVKILNPWLRSRSLTVRPGKKYIIQLPNDNSDRRQ